ncbi:MAG TPA: DNA ligase D [Steroidobacteraceae bacterium]|nr:DNA ligase D [Steroidobacteraceae bacterium]
MKRPLDRYAEKRSFKQTPEPAPSILTSRVGPLLFVVQKHAARHLHYDLRLEVDGVLKSWAVPKGPSFDPTERRLAVETEDHPFDYASFEGIIPAKQYGAGNMIVWDCGVYSPDEDHEYAFEDREGAQARVREGLAQGKLSILLRGEKLKGSFALVRTNTENQWLLLKHKDRYVSREDVNARRHSVLTKRAVDELTSGDAPARVDAGMLTVTGPLEKLPAKLTPMLADSVETIETDERWLYEPKLDGYRTMAVLNNGEVKLISRGGLDVTIAYPEVVKDLQQQAVGTMILDGEIVAYGKDGKPSFGALQKRAQLKTAKEIAAAQRESKIALVCFDLLHFAGINVRTAAYADRRRYLSQCLLPTEHLQLIHVSDDAEQLYAAALDLGFEGIMAKRKDSPYQPGKRVATWLKVKATHTEEFVVGGYTQGRGSRQALGALLLGTWEGKQLRYAGHVGSGLDDETLDALRPKLPALTRKTHPFAAKPDLHRPTTWLEPTLVAEVTFQNRTESGMLRAPVFVRFRDDIDVREVGAAREPPADHNDEATEVASVLEQLDAKASTLTIAVGDARIKLTNLDREYWPGDSRAKLAAVTKRDLIRYLAAVSPYMLTHLRDRPLTMIRMPEGINGERFFQKHWEQAMPEFVKTINVFSEHKDEKHGYILANNLPTLLWLGQVGTLEFHVWHSRVVAGEDAITQSLDFDSSVESLETSVANYPDYLVFDIDPYIYSGKEAKGAEPEYNKKAFAVGKKVAFWLHELLREMSLEAIVKTSGKTGLHVFVPIHRAFTFTEVRHICELVGRHLMRDHPKDITMEWAVVKRTGKIFMDYNMNVRGKTLNVAYSPRGVPGAPISMPMTWEELEAAEPMQFTMRNVLSRLEKTGDRWHDALTSKQNLTDLIGKRTDPG